MQIKIEMHIYDIYMKIEVQRLLLVVYVFIKLDEIIYFEVKWDLRILKLIKQMREVEKNESVRKIHKGLNKL